VIRTAEEIAEVRRVSRALVRRRAKAAAAIAVVPLPGLDIAVDAALLVDIIPRISRSFGLTPEQLDKLESPRRMAAYKVIRRVGARFAGAVITADLIARTLATIGVELAIESVTKYLPIAGAVVSSVISYQVFRRIADAHIEECVKIVQTLIEEPAADDDATTPC
jgi:uncharacterized protein (DUF697 family)